MINIYYCIEPEIFEQFIQYGSAKTIILISELDKYSENDTLIITQECKLNLDSWKGMILFI